MSTVHPAAPARAGRVPGALYTYQSALYRWDGHHLRRVCRCPLQARARLGLPGERPAWCSGCPDKPSAAVMRWTPQCECGSSQPTYSLAAGMKARWCLSCPTRPADALNYRDTLCECGTVQPTFGVAGGRAQWCRVCKPDTAVDVVNRMCACGKRASCAASSNERPTWCSGCKPTNAANVVSARCGCVRAVIASFFLPGETRARWCSNCPDRPDNTVSHVPRCITCQLLYPDRARYGNQCAACFWQTHPELEPPRPYRTRERHLFRRVQADFPDRFQYDRAVEGGCSGRRPDLFVDCLTHVLHGENDENMHSQTACENRRLMELFEDTARRPMVVVRFNPDSYTDCAGQRHASTFFYDEKRVLCVNEEAWEARYVVFKARLEYWLTTIPTKEVLVEHLFYDGYGANEQ